MTDSDAPVMTPRGPHSHDSNAVALTRPRNSLGGRIADFFFGYDFFISYAHADGNNYPRVLAAALEKRGYKVFLDEREYSAGEDLRIGTRRMVGKSRYLVLIARDQLVNREERAETNWVRQEVEACLEAKRTPIVIDVNGAYSQASPANYLSRLLTDRIFVPEAIADADGVPSERVIQKLAEGFKVTRQDVIRLRWISAAAFGLLVLAGVAAWQAWVAEKRRVEAERQRDEAVSRLLTIEGRRLMQEEPDTALLLAAEAVRMRASATARDLLRTLLVSEPRMDRFLQAAGTPWRLVAFAADGSAMLSNADDASTTVWRVNGDRLDTVTMEKANQELSSIALSADGFRAAGGTRDGKRVFLWDARTGALERSLDADHKGPVEGLAFSPDATLLVSGGAFTATFLWDVAQGTRRAQLDQHKSGVRAIAFAPDGKSVATAAEGGRVVIWSLDALQPSHRVLDEGVPPFVFALAYSADGRTLAAGGEGDAITVWRLGEERPAPARLAGQHSGEVVQLRFGPDPTVLAARSRDGRLTFYDLSSGSRKPRYAPLDAGPTPYGDFAWTQDGKGLLTAGPGTFARRWTLERPVLRNTRLLAGHPRGTTNIAFDSRGALYSIGCPGPRAAILDPGCALGEEIRVWDAATASPLGAAATIDGRRVTNLASRRDEKTLLLVLDGGHLAVWDTAQQRIVAEYPRPKPPPPPVNVPKGEPKPAGGASAPAFAATSVFVQSVTGFQQVVAGLPPAACVVHNTSPDAIAISPGGETVHFGGGRKGCVFRWKEGEGWAALPLLEHGAAIVGIAVSTDGQRIAVGDDKGSLAMWQVMPTVKRAWTHELGKDSRITALAFSPAGDLLLVGLGTRKEEPRKGFFQPSRTVGRALLWSVTQNQLLSSIATAVPVSEGGPVDAVAFSPDGSLAVVGGCRREGGMFGCNLGEVVLWDIASSQQIGPPIAVHTDAVKRIAVREDGGLMATVADSQGLDNDPSILIWDLRAASWIATACELAGRGFSPAEKQRYLSGLGVGPCRQGELPATLQPAGGAQKK
jgi:WD40 repeat protein